MGREGQHAWLEQGKNREGYGPKVAESSALSTFPPSVWSGKSHHGEGNELEGEHSYPDCHLCHSPILRTFPWYLKKGCLDVDKEDHWGPACSAFLFAFYSTSYMFSSIQPIYSDCKLCLFYSRHSRDDTKWNLVRQKSLHSRSVHSWWRKYELRFDLGLTLQSPPDVLSPTPPLFLWCAERALRGGGPCLNHLCIPSTQ